MKARSTFLLLGLALLFGAYLFYWESGPVEEKNEGPAAAHLFDFEADAAQGVQVEVDGAKLALSSRDGAWTVAGADGKSHAADTDLVRDFLESLRALEGSEVAQEGAVDLGRFGLSPSKGRVEIKGGGRSKDKNQDFAYVLLVGDESPLGSKRYAAVEGQPKVFLLDGYVVKNLGKKPSDLRPRKLLVFDRSKVEGVEVFHHKLPALRLSRKEGKWLVAAPAGTAGPDPAKVDRLIEDLSLLRVSDFTGESATPGKPQGLDKPTQRYRLLDAAGAALAQVEFGDRKEGSSGGVFARVPDLDEALLVSTWAVDKLFKTPEDLAKEAEKTPAPAPDTAPEEDTGD